MLAILTTHPIQYQVPVWQALAKDGGVDFEVWYLTAHAVQRSHDPGFGTDFAWDMDLLAGYPHRFLDVAQGATPGSFWKCRLKEKLRHRLRAGGARALWIQGWQVAAYWQAVPEAKAAGVEVWLRGESNDLAPIPWWKSAAKKLLLQHLFQRVDRFLYIGSGNRRLYEKFAVAPDKLYWTPYAVDNDRFAKQSETVRGQRSDIRGHWGIPENAYCILFCGKFISKKRPLDLVGAAQLLMTNDRLPNVHLLFVGSGELGPELRANCSVVFDAESSQAQTNKEQITNNQKPFASFAGFLNQTEISKAYVGADVLVLPSDYGETWGLVVNEAMASGLPCIVSDQCGCAEDLGYRGSNAVYRCGDTEQLAQRLCAVSTCQNSASAKEEIRLFSIEKTVDTIVQLSKQCRLLT
jgi:glycosyltransferase involved in cell wall biosynthesis